jgi:MFS family permease
MICPSEESMKLKRPQVLLYFVNAFFWMTVYTYVPIFPAYLQNTGVSATMIGIITGSYGVMQMLLRLPLGILSDRLHRRKPFIIAGIAVGALSSLMMFFIGTPMAMLAGRLMAGLSACAYVQISILFSSYYDVNNTSKSLGFVEGSTAAGQLTAMLLGGFASSLFSDRYTFLLAALLGCVGIALASFAQESRIERIPATVGDIGKVVSERTLIVASVLAIFVQAVNFGKAFVFAPLAASAFGATPLQKSALTMFSPLSGGRLAPRYGTRSVVAAGFALQAVSCAMVPFAPSIGWLYASQFLTGLGYAVAFPSLMTLGISKMPPEKRATAMGFYQSVYGIGILCGPLLTGFLTNWIGKNPSFFVNAAMAVAAGIAAILFISSTAGFRSGVSSQQLPINKVQ